MFTGPLTSSQSSFLMALNLICTSLSMLSELFLFVAFLRNPALRTFSFKLIISLTFADFMYSIANFMSLDRENPVSCNIEGFVRNLSLVQSTLWVPVILAITRKQVRNFDANFGRHFGRIFGAVWVLSFVPPMIVTINDMTNGSMYYSVLLIFCSI